MSRRLSPYSSDSTLEAFSDRTLVGISPEKINLQLGDDRALQLLDDSAQELQGSTWSIDNPDLADLREDDGLMVLHAKALGTVRVTATLNEETRTEEITIWSALRRLPEGMTNWSVRPIGREIGDIPAVLPENLIEMPDIFVYQVNQDGELVYRLPLPKYPGPLRDEIVIGSNELAFATRGGILIAFKVTDGKDLWQWDSGTDDVSVVAALAGGSCLVQTPSDAMVVQSSTRAKVFLHGKVMLGWQGQVYRKHN